MTNKKKQTIILLEKINPDSIRRKSIIEENGYDVIHAAAIEEASDIIRKTPGINLALLDTETAGATSETAAAERMFEKHQIPVVFLLHDAESSIIDSVIKSNTYGYVTRESGDKLLTASIETALRCFAVKKLEKVKEKEVRAGKDRYRSIFENTGTLMFIIDNDMTINMVNDEFVKEFGYSREEVVGRMKWPELVAPECLEFMKGLHKLRRSKPEEAPRSYEFKYITKSGDVRYGIMSVGMIRGTDQSIASVTDITELKKAKVDLKRKNDELQTVNEELAAINEEFEAATEELIETNTLLEEKERFYRTLFENTGSSIIVIEEDTTISLANENFAKKVGYTREELEGKYKWTEMVSEDDLDRMLKQHRLRRNKPSEAESSYEFRFKTRTGELLDTLLFITLIPGTGKSIASLFDITERKKTQRALQVSENKYRTIFENVQDVFYQTDLEGIITEISPSIEKYSTFTREELIGMQVKSVYSDTTERDRFVDLVLQNGRVTDYELQLKTKDNRVVIVSSNSHLLYNSAGHPVGVEGTLRDISERKLAEKSLREAEQKYRTLVENLIEIVYRLDGNAVITYISPNVEDIIGFSPSEIAGRKLSDFINQEDLSDNLELLKRVMSGSISTFEYRISGKNGSEHWFRTTPRPVVEKGRTTGVQGVLTEITVLKKTEEEKKNLEKDILRIQKMELIGTLAGGIAHNFNNILMGIMGYTSLMMSERGSGDPEYEYLKNISDSVSAATELTKNLLGFARGGKYEVKPVDINDLIRREIRIFSQTRKEVSIESFLNDELPAVIADQGQLRQVLLNLFINACQAMPDGGKIYVRTENTIISGHDFDDFNVRSGEYIKVSVTDTGTGMDKTVLENIFTPFFSTKDKGEGTGLGLASVYGIITNHGGSIKAYSEPGLGSTFVFILPAAETAVKESGETEKPEKLIKGNGVILLVDDETMILNVGEKLLRYLGYDVLKAKSGKEAIEIYTGNFRNITMVILDMIMPDMDGRETYERLYSINPGVIVLLASGYSIDDYAQKILKHGFCGFIQKPYNLNDLSGKIHETLNSNLIKI